MELADGLKTCMMAALKEWKDKNDNPFPEKIIFYRDGVGDGQLEAVSKHELGQIMAAFRVSGKRMCLIIDILYNCRLYGSSVRAILLFI